MVQSPKKVFTLNLKSFLERIIVRGGAYRIVLCNFPDVLFGEIGQIAVLQCLGGPLVVVPVLL